MLRRLFILAALLSLLSLALGFGGSFHPLGDSLAVFRLPNLAVSALLAFALRGHRVFIAALVLLALSAASLALYYIPQSENAHGQTDDALRLYQKNLRFDVQDRAELKSDILGADSDFITLQELYIKGAGDPNLTFISELKAAYPYELRCPFSPVGEVSILSRWPIIKTHCIESKGIGAIQVQSPQGPLWVLSVHLYWPYPNGQAGQVERAIEPIKNLKGPKVLAGDFNMVPWSHTLKAMQRASETKPAKPVIHSFDLPIIGMRIPIDHVLLPRGSKAKLERRGKFGSDHYGLLATFNLP